VNWDGHGGDARSQEAPDGLRSQGISYWYVRLSGPVLDVKGFRDGA